MDILPSEKAELLDRIKELRQEKDAIYNSSLRRVTRVVNTCKFLDDEQKTMLLELIWNGD